MILLQGVFDFAQGLAGDVRTTAQVIVGAAAAVFIVVNAVRSKLSVANLIVTLLAAGLLIAAIPSLMTVSGWMQTEIK